MSGSLDGLRVAVTRSATSPCRLSDLLRGAGALPVGIPLTRTEPPSDAGALDRAVGGLLDYDWLVVTSPRAVEPLLASLERAGIAVDAVRRRSVRVCAVGPRTGDALRAAGLVPDLVPERFAAEGVVEALLGQEEPAGLRVFFPRAEEGRDTIPRLLGNAGVEVGTVTAYRTAPIPSAGGRLARMVADGEVDALTFTAGSAATVFVDAWSRRSSSEGGVHRTPPPLPAEVGVVALGPATAGVLADAGVAADRVADPHTFEGLVAALEDWAEARGGEGAREGG